MEVFMNKLTNWQKVAVIAIMWLGLSSAVYFTMKFAPADSKQLVIIGSYGMVLLASMITGMVIAFSQSKEALHV